MDEEIVYEDISNLSGFNGSLYDGAYDPFISHFRGPGVGSMADQYAYELDFKFEIANSSLTAQKVYFNNFFGNTETGRVIREGVIPYTVGQTNLVCTSENLLMDVFIAWVQDNPQMILSQQIESSTDSQFNEKIYQRTNINPFKPSIRYPIMALSKKKDIYAQNSKLVRVDVPFILDKETATDVSIPAGATTSFIWTIGVHMSSASAFRAKSINSQKNPMVRQAQTVAAGNNAPGGTGLVRGLTGGPGGQV
jgi:hypothetical protein